MSLIKLNKNSKFLSIKISYSNNNDTNEIKNNIILILNKYCKYLRWNVIEILNNTSYSNSLNYYIYVFAEPIQINIIDALIKKYFNTIFYNNIFIYYGCLTRIQFNKELKLYKNNKLNVYFKDIEWKEKIINYNELIY